MDQTVLRARPAGPDDWPAAWAIQRAAFDDLVTRTWGGWDAEQERKCRDAWDPDSTRLLLDEVGTARGWIRLRHHPEHDWLDLIVLDPTLQGHGLGATWMRTLMAEAQARGVPLWLSVYRDNAARRLYARLGFVELERDSVRVWMVWPASAPLVPPA